MSNQQISDDALNNGGLSELRHEIARVIAVNPDLPLAELVHAVRILVVERREALEWCDRHRPLLGHSPGTIDTIQDDEGDLI